MYAIDAVPDCFPKRKEHVLNDVGERVSQMVTDGTAITIFGQVGSAVETDKSPITLLDKL